MVSRSLLLLGTRKSAIYKPLLLAENRQYATVGLSSPLRHTGTAKSWPSARSTHADANIPSEVRLRVRTGIQRGGSVLDGVVRLERLEVLRIEAVEKIRKLRDDGAVYVDDLGIYIG